MAIAHFRQNLQVSAREMCEFPDGWGVDASEREYAWIANVREFDAMFCLTPNEVSQLYEGGWLDDAIMPAFIKWADQFERMLESVGWNVSLQEFLALPDVGELRRLSCELNKILEEDSKTWESRGLFEEFGGD